MQESGFSVLYKQLTRLNVLLPLGDADELSGMRSDYRVAFAQLVQSAIDNVCNNPVRESSQVLFSKVAIASCPCFVSYSEFSFS